MDIKFEIEPIFKIEFFKIKCIKFKQKKLAIEKILKSYPETFFFNFYSNRNNVNITEELNIVNYDKEYKKFIVKLNNNKDRFFPLLFLHNNEIIVK